MVLFLPSKPTKLQNMADVTAKMAHVLFLGECRLGKSLPNKCLYVLARVLLYLPVKETTEIKEEMMRNLIVRPSRYHLSNEIDDFFNNFFAAPYFKSGDAKGSCNCSFSPPVDVRETANDLTLTFEIPGMDKNDIKVWVEDHTLTVSGERKIRDEENGDNFIRSEIHTGNFSRSFTLPKTVDLGRISADYKNGLLSVTLGKVEEAKPKEIEVKVK
jgi:HSP20 family protein